MLSFPIYLDYNSTTPVDGEVLNEMLPLFNKNFGNPASKTHKYGWEAEEYVEIAREKIADLIHATPHEIIFTSGATEAINLGIKGVAEYAHEKGNHIITCKTEHKAVLDTCHSLEKNGFEITFLETDSNGHIDLNILLKSIRKETLLVCLMYANNETGVIHPIEEVSEITRSKNVLLFVDGTQGVGKIPVDVEKSRIDLMAFSSHKIYGPKGCGALYLRRQNPRVTLVPQMDGGGHERGFRSGTLNTAGIVGFGKAAEICSSRMEHDYKLIETLRNKLENALTSDKNIHVNGDTKNRLPNVSNLSFGKMDGAFLITSLKNIAIASGSACTSANPEPSHVLLAMGLTKQKTGSSVRFSLGRFTTEEEIDYTIEYVLEVVKKLNKI